MPRRSDAKSQTSMITVVGNAQLTILNVRLEGQKNAWGAVQSSPRGIPYSGSTGRGTMFNANPLVRVGGNAVVIMDNPNARIMRNENRGNSNNWGHADNGTGIRIYDNGHFIMKDGWIEGNLTGVGSVGGAVFIYGAGAKFSMLGGQIRNNHTYPTTSYLSPAVQNMGGSFDYSGGIVYGSAGTGGDTSTANRRVGAEGTTAAGTAANQFGALITSYAATTTNGNPARATASNPLGRSRRGTHQYVNGALVFVSTSNILDTDGPNIAP
jgi:hypothetical protein